MQQLKDELIVSEDPGLRVRGPEVSKPSSVFLSRPALALVTLLGIAGLLELVPGLERLRLLSAKPTKESTAPVAAMASAPKEIGEAELSGETTTGVGAEATDGQRAQGPIAAASPAAAPKLDKEPPVALFDPSGKALDGFFAALDRVQGKQPGAIARIAHFGDSIVVSDLVSGTLRRKFQSEFGDAGHGFMLIANAWPAYFHNDVTRYATSGWKVSRIVGPLAADNWYGLGGVSFRADAHALARWGTAKSGEFGKNVSRFTIVYVEEPKGGRFQVRLDGKDVGVVDTSGAEKRVRQHDVSAPDGSHELEIQTLSGQSRLFGVILERDVPGVVLDALGVQGAPIRFLDQQDDAHWAEQLGARKPDLVIYQFGANESGAGLSYPMAEYHRTMKDVVAQGRKALPQAGCLLIGAMDRAKKEGDVLVSMSIIPHLIEEQRKVAEELGCAFFDTFRAMGGNGSMPSWVRRGLGNADMVHPTGAGADALGTWIFRALLKNYAEYKARRR
ncbi:MAG TPA: GDSL-type esterase/lipase family protein [Polyangiaceae bacterium]|nr:GDSL-type esterase/lipase family protein [Polyangiaceae bacterium]